MSEQTCSTCGLWRRRQKPDRRESTEYQTWRPCGVGGPAGYRPGLTGPAAESYGGGNLLTAPECRCRMWIAEEAVHRGKSA